jgi:hypothetical protein
MMLRWVVVHLALLACTASHALATECGVDSPGKVSCQTQYPGGGFCCSQYGWCGDTSAHCGTGCQPGTKKRQNTGRPGFGTILVTVGNSSDVLAKTVGPRPFARPHDDRPSGFRLPACTQAGRNLLMHWAAGTSSTGAQGRWGWGCQWGWGWTGTLGLRLVLLQVQGLMGLLCSRWRHHRHLGQTAAT